MKSPVWTNERYTSRIACVAIFIVALLGSVSPSTAFATGFARSKAGPKSVCPELTVGNTECEALRVPTVSVGSSEAVGAELQGTGERGGFDPKDLRSAYKLPETGGSSQTVAIVDAYNDPNAESDLKVYRERYGLSACTEANGCFQEGQPKRRNQKLSRKRTRVER
jgi:hypothetical protein